MIATADFVAVDLGASSGRLMAGQWDGSRFTLKEVHRFPNTGVSIGDSFYWNPLEIWKQILAGLIKVRAEIKNVPAGIGVEAWGVDYALLDAKDRLLGNPHHYRDRRTDGMVQRVDPAFGARELFRTTGVQTMQINTLFQLYSEVCKDSGVLGCAQGLLMIPDLFQFFLCGEKASEYTEATTTQLYSLPEKRWANDVLSMLNIPRKLFRAVVFPGKILGPVRSSVLENCGFSASFPAICVGSHDTASAVAAIPELDEHSAFLSSGTWSLMGILNDKPDISDEAFRLGFTNEGAADGGVLLLKNLNGLWILQECQRNWLGRGQSLEWSDLERAAAAAPSFQSWIDTNANDFQMPCNMPAAIANYCRGTIQHIPESVGDIARCIFESLSFSYRVVLDDLEQLTRRNLCVLRIVGGGSLNRFLCQMIADATGRTVVAGPAEATAYGNVMVQAVATGHVSDFKAGRQAVKNSVECVPYQPGSHDKWSDAYMRFKSLLNARRVPQHSHA